MKDILSLQDKGFFDIGRRLLLLVLCNRRRSAVTLNGDVADVTPFFADLSVNRFEVESTFRSLDSGAFRDG